MFDVIGTNGSNGAGDGGMNGVNEDRSGLPGGFEFHAFRPNCFETVCKLVRKNARNILGGKHLRFNEMTGQVELGGKPIADDDLKRIREQISVQCPGGSTKGIAFGMKQSISDICDACDIVSREKSYHPVRQYLEKIKWDGTPRLAAAVEDILGAQRTELNQTLLTKWFISAVARAMQPGCKVDTALILVGKQGARKSTFFAELSPWFVDTGLDISNKDSFMVMRKAWIVEWPELETMRKAKEINAVKAFLSSKSDTYRAPFARCVQEIERGCVIVGTTNNEEFLVDDTGNRRFWPIRVGQTDIKLLIAQRDQLWAEAVALYQAGENWWLTPDQSDTLALAQREHETDDPWQTKVAEYVASRDEARVTDILGQALQIEVGRWTRAEEMRCARILTRLGWHKTRRRDNARFWTPPPAAQLQL